MNPNITGTIAPGGGDPTMRYSQKTKQFSVSMYDRELGKYQTAPVTEPFLLDFGSARHGWEKFRKGHPYSLKLVPLNDELPDKPDEDHHSVGCIAVIIPSLGRAELIIDRDAVSDQIADLYEEYLDCVQAARGMIPKIKSSATGLKIIEWAERKDRFLGPRLVPAPILMASTE